MDHDFSLIKITMDPEDGTSTISFAGFFERYEDLKDLLPSEAFVKELERLSKMPYSDEVADKIREVIKKGFARAKQGETTHFAVHSMVRSRFNRTQRAQAPQHARFKQHVGSDQRRLLRNRPLVITEADLKRDRGELLELQKTGLLEVRTLDGRLLDLDSFQIAPPAPAENPRPSPILDSVANDIPTGIPFPKLQGGTILSPGQVQQVVEGMTSIDGELQIDPKDGTAIVHSMEAPTPDEEELLEELQEAEELQELTAEEEEIEELPPGIPPPPPPAGGMPRPKKNKHKR